MSNTPLTSLVPNSTPGTAGYGPVVQYNGITFNTTCKAHLNCTPVYDQAQRVVTHLQYHLSVHGFIARSTESEESASMASLQDALTEPGKPLTIKTFGFDSGTFSTAKSGATDATRPDLIWGAKPRLLSLDPAGGQLAWEFTWECEFNVSRAVAASAARLNNFLAFNYEWAASIDQEGLTTRTIAGYCQVAAIRGDNAARTLLFNVDAKWDQISVAVPYGFRRIANNRRINDARNRIDFVIVDKELTGEAFPAGIVEANIEYSFANNPPAFVEWNGTISGTLTVAPGLPAWLAAEKFFLILYDRIGRLRDAVHASGIEHWVLPRTLQFSRDMFGRTSRFSVSFLVIGCLRDIVGQSGIFEPLGFDYTAWASDMQQSKAWDNRGRAGLRFSPNDDSLIDLASSTASVNIGRDGTNVQSTGGNYSRVFSCEGVTPERSWIGYRNKISVIRDVHANAHQLSQSYTPTPLPEVNTFATVGMTAGPTGDASYSDSYRTEYTSPPAYYVLAQGAGMRLRYQPVPLAMATYNGVELEELNRNVEVEAKGSFFGCPMFMGRWAILYRAKSAISDISAASNPTACFIAEKK
ncbi:MAG: hypothetical protein AB7O62_11435 [Pirellulales bacterium]